MINLLELHIRNFFSYGNNITKVPLKFKQPILIIGENRDVVVDGEYDNNGTGKSSILNALAYCLYGKPVSTGIKVDELINNINKKNLYVATIFEVNGIYYKVERWRKNSKMGGTANSGVKIISGSSIDDLDNPDNEKTPAGRTADEYIAENILCMPFEIFVRIVVYSARHEAFLSLPITHTTKTSQTSILEELFGQTELTEKAIRLKEVIKNTTADIKQLTQLNEQIEAETNRYTEQLEYAKNSISQWDEEKEQQIIKIKQDIDKLEKIDFDVEIKLIEGLDKLKEAIKDKQVEQDKLALTYNEHTKNKRLYDEWNVKHQQDIESANKLMTPYKDIDFVTELQSLEKIEKLHSDYKKEVDLQKDLNSDISDTLERIKKLDDEISALKESKCPYCSQDYHDKNRIAEEDNKLMNLAQVYTQLDSDVEKSKQRSDKIADEIEAIECRYDNMIDYGQSKNAYDNLIDKLDNLNKAENPFLESLGSEKDIKSCKDSIDTSQIEIEGLNQKLNELSDKLNDEYTKEFLYSEQSRLKELHVRLIDKVSEDNPHIETVQRLKKVFDTIDESRMKEVDDLKILLEHQSFLLKLLTKKDSFIRQALLDANLPLLNTRLRHYLDIIGLPHKVEFTKEMTISISQFGNPISFANLSGGQQARINIGIAFSFRDVVQARHQKINFCILDECLDTGLSNLGVKLASKMIKQVAKENDLSMYIITHRDEIKSSFEKKLKSILDGGLTTLEFS